MSDLQTYMLGLGQKAKLAAQDLRLAENKTRKTAILAMAEQIQNARHDIIIANEKDMQAGEKKHLGPALLDRLMLDDQRVEAIANGLQAIAELPDTIGEIEKKWTRPNGLEIAKVRTPIGVIGMIYESRPNVTADAAALCIKSANACILRGGSEAINSNKSIHQALTKGLEQAGLAKNCIQYVNTTDREAVGLMLRGLEGNIDLIIPRGGKSLVARVQNDARIPVLAHLEGRNHIFVDKHADIEMTKTIILNAKLRRPGICGAVETLLIDKMAKKHLNEIVEVLQDGGCEIRACEKTLAQIPDLKLASEQDFQTEYLDKIINIKIVDGLAAALAHIEKYGSNHTDAIITNNEKTAKEFLAKTDSAIVMHNASTQFADGGEFGFGAEIGIATGRLHARGPVGAEHLTSYKYCVLGNGQVRPK